MVDERQSPDETQAEPQVVHVKPPLRQRVGRAALIVWLVLVAVFSIANLNWVDFDWIVGSTQVVEVDGERQSGGVPLVLLLAGAFASGLLTGMLLVGVRARRARRAEKKKRA